MMSAARIFTSITRRETTFYLNVNNSFEYLSSPRLNSVVLPNATHFPAKTFTRYSHMCFTRLLPSRCLLVGRVHRVSLPVPLV